MKAFEIICSIEANKAFSAAECKEIAGAAIERAQQKDTGSPEGFVLGFDDKGQEWAVVVNLGGCWAKILRKDELDSAIEDATIRN